jgi:HAD-superfamily hydrolase, subfamily IIB
MIKLIASDIDGTLLNSNHQLSEQNIAAIQKAKKAGIEFVISTGRKYDDALSALERDDLADGYITLSGAEIRNREGKVSYQVPLTYDKIEEILWITKSYSVAVILNSEDGDYIIGTQEEFKNSLKEQMKLFFGIDQKIPVEESPIFQKIVGKTKCVSSLQTIKSQGITIYKIFIFSRDQNLIDALSIKFGDVEEIASASSFISNIEITQLEAQKGRTILKYMKEKGYSMDEVMVLGDSMNDYSMISMDYGATVAMENAVGEIKAVAKYITSSNDENGVARAIEYALEGRLEELKNKIW